MEGQAISYSGQGFSLRGEKGCFVLPPQFRKSVRESSEGNRTLCLAKHERWNCLTGFGLSRKDAFTAQIDREEMLAIQRGHEFDRDLRQIQLFGFTEVPFDDSGRFPSVEPGSTTLAEGPCFGTLRTCPVPPSMR